jgi:type I restriction enzyme S subunit
MTQFFETTLWYGEIAKRAAEGARNHGLLNISAEDF